MAHIREGFECMKSEESLQKAGFTLEPFTFGSEHDIQDEWIGVEEEMAQRFGGFVLALASARQRRCLYYLSWPLGMCRALAGPEHAASTLDAFCKDLANFQKLVDMKDKTSSELQIIKRHVVTLTCNNQ